MHCVVHGIPLPPLGSFEYQVLETGLERSRAEKVAFARLLTGLLSPLSEMDSRRAELLVAGYAESVFQVRYNYKYTPAHIRVLERRRMEHLKDAQLMSKVDSLTVPGKM